MKLYNADCMEVMSDIGEGSVDLILTDPPYGVEFSKGFNDSLEHVKEHIENWLDKFYDILKETGHVYIFVPNKEIDLWVGAVKQAGFKLMNILSTRTYTNSLYLKNNFSFNNQLIIFASKGKAKRLNRVDYIPTSEAWLNDKRNKNPKPFTYSYPSFLPFFSNEKKTMKSKKIGEHPCSKSVNFAEFLIQLSSNEGDVVLDPFMGGGSIGVACKNLNRNFIGIELDETYFNIAKDRLNGITAS